MANGDFEEEFGEWNYLTHMAQHAWKGLPKEVLWEMEADKSGDVDKALDSLIERSEPTDGDALTAYEEEEESMGDGWDDGDYDDLDYFFIPQEGAALEGIFAAIEDGNMEQGLSDVGTIVSSTIPLDDPYTGVGPPSWGDLYAGANASYFGSPIDDDPYAGVGAGVQGPPSWGDLYAGANAAYFGPPLEELPTGPGLLGTIEKVVTQMLGLLPVGTVGATGVGDPTTPPTTLQNGEAYDPEEDPEYDYYFVANTTDVGRQQEVSASSDVWAALTKAYYVGGIDEVRRLMDEKIGWMQRTTVSRSTRRYLMP